MSSGQLAERDQSWWWERLLVAKPSFGCGRAFFQHRPSDPRCNLCAAPFEGSAAR